MLKLKNLKFIRLFDSFMHDRKKLDYNIRSQKFAYPSLMNFFRWITKNGHGVSNITDEEKARIRIPLIALDKQDRN